MSMDDNVSSINKYGYQRGRAIFLFFLQVHVHGYDTEARPQKAPTQRNFSCLGRMVASKIALNYL